MGQRLSALRRHRVIDDDTPFLFKQVLPSKENCAAVSSSSIIESVQFNLVEISSRISRELEAESAPTTLPELPTELIIDIAKYLAPSAFMSLSYSCRTIRNKMDTSILHVLGDKVSISRGSPSAPSIEVRNTRFLERLELRHMLGRDGKIFSSKAFYIGCSDTHDCCLFSAASLAQPDSRRHCLGCAGLVWACPHRTFGYKKATRTTGAQNLHTCVRGVTDVYSGPECGSFEPSGCLYPGGL